MTHEPPQWCSQHGVQEVEDVFDHDDYEGRPVLAAQLACGCTKTTPIRPPSTRRRSA